MNSTRVIEMINRDSKYNASEPIVFLFEEKTKNAYDKVHDELINQNFKMIDINEYVKIQPNDYDLRANDVGFEDTTNTITIKDFLVSEVEKRITILKYKLNKLQEIVDEKAVLQIRYNDLFTKDEMFFDGGRNFLYEIIRSWLKDGYDFDDSNSEIPLISLVFCDTKDNIADFCRYGIRVDENN